MRKKLAFGKNDFQFINQNRKRERVRKASGSDRQSVLVLVLFLLQFTIINKNINRTEK